jgi:hypothetical protein
MLWGNFCFQRKSSALSRIHAFCSFPVIARDIPRWTQRQAKRKSAEVPELLAAPELLTRHPERCVLSNESTESARRDAKNEAPATSSQRTMTERGSPPI